MSKISFRVRRGLEVPVQDLPRGVLGALKEAFTHSNPEFKKKQRLGFYTGSTPRTIDDYGVERDHWGEWLVLPRGGTEQVRRALAARGYFPEYVDERLELPGVDFDLRKGSEPVELRAHQVRIVESALARENALIRSATGCLAAGTEIGVNRAGKSFKIRIEDLVHRFNGGRITWGNPKQGHLKREGKLWDPDIPTLVRSATPDGYVRLHCLLDAYESGIRKTYAVRTECGRLVRATKDHRFLTPDGWARLSELSEGDLILVELPRGGSSRAPKRNYKVVGGLRAHPYAGRRGVERGGHSVPEHRLVVEAELNDMTLNDFVGEVRDGRVDGLTFLNPSTFHVHHLDGDHQNNVLGNLAVLPVREHLRLHGAENGWRNVTARVGPSRIASIVYADEEPTYDLEMDGEPRNFLASGVVVHNSGKTEAALEFIRRARQPAVVIVWTAGLQQQWIDRIRLRWGWPYKEIGRWGGGTKRLGRVTVAMQQSLSRPGVTEDLAANFGTVVCDEVQKFAAKTFLEVVSKMPARYRLGLSADERRKDRKDFLIREHFGPVVEEVSKDELVALGHLCEVELVVVPTAFRYPEIEDAAPQDRAEVLSKHYSKMLGAMEVDAERNAVATRIAAFEVRRRESSVLVFCERVGQARALCREIAIVESIPCGLMLGQKKNREAFEEAKERLTSGELRCAVGSKAAYQGEDIPRLSVGIVVTPTGSNRQLLEQQVGRLRRKFGGKVMGRLYYLWDAALFPDALGNLKRWYPGLVKVQELGEILG